MCGLTLFLVLYFITLRGAVRSCAQGASLRYVFVVRLIFGLCYLCFAGAYALCSTR